MQARDALGNNKTSGDDAFEVTLAGPGAQQLAAVPQHLGDGLFHAEYVPTVPGRYSVAVTLGGAHIQCGA